MINNEVARVACCGCHACAQACPKNCIAMQADAEGFLHPQVDEAACIRCGRCMQVCPVLHPLESAEQLPMCYAAVNTDESVRAASSSGGIFSLLAQHVMAAGGVVYGAAMSQDGRRAVHIAAQTPEQLAALRGSKYVQSEIGNCYREAEQALKQGRPVLFSGTPCQIDGLRLFLNREYESLLCVDLICHGTPAPAAWQTYLKEKEIEAGASVTAVYFRNKTSGWKNMLIALQFDGQAQAVPVSENDFWRAFLSDACLRPSCYQCPSKTANRRSDITLADFWGVEKVVPEMDDNRGTSLVLIHSEKGRAAFDGLEGVRRKAVDFTQAIAHNPPMIRSVTPHRKREAFMRDIQAMPFSAAVKKNLPRRRLKGLVSKALRRLGLLNLVKRIIKKG